jgi:5-methyltetrahydropteroyltriglutamate--homocysteine methyltransferase
MTTGFGQSTVLGYPRIGPHRELKRAVEAYWAGRADAATLKETAAGLRAEVWRTLRDAGLASIPSNTFSYYDHMLDTAVAVAVAVDAVPDRFRRLGLSDLDTYFAMARGICRGEGGRRCNARRTRQRRCRCCWLYVTAPVET